jgi:succinyl-CoA synthetase alpha subunit
VPISARIEANLYKDSVALMRVAETVLMQDGVRRATLLMGTPANKEILAQAGLFRAEFGDARPADLMLVIDAETREALALAEDQVSRLLRGEEDSLRGPARARAIAPRSIAMACARAGDAALAQISVPGPYAAAEALKALRQGLHVFLFSDNVPPAQERAIKMLARDKGLLVMGPDCGTAIVGGTPLGFANVVRPGAIGLVGASGTGLQEVTCQIHALGQGVRQAIGTGGRDVSAEIGGITMHQAIDLLAADRATHVIGIVAKPPAPAVARRILDRLCAIDKPSVVLFLGAELSTERLPEHVVVARTLYDVARGTVAFVQGKRTGDAPPDGAWLGAAQAEARRLSVGQQDLRGLYSGGTFCAEAQVVWRDHGLRTRSNAPVDGERTDGSPGAGHSALDLGSGDYTVGRPHPMIDPGPRIERILAEARDPACAAIVLDVVLGYGSHADPAGALAPAIETAKADCARAGRHLAVLAFVCGTEEDPQQRSTQEAQLRAAGALVVPGSTAAARVAAEIALHAPGPAPAAAP